MKVLFVLTMILLGGLCSSCVSDCGAVGCSDGLSIKVTTHDEQPIDAFAATLTLDGIEYDASCPSSRYGYGASECRLDGLWVYGNPAHVVLSVDSGGEQGTLELEPRYKERSPNGPDCGPVCKSAAVVLTLAPK